MATGRFLPFAFAALAPLAVGACGGHTGVSRAEGGCDRQIILSLAPGIVRTDKVIKDIARGANVRLDYLRSSSETLHIFRLTAEGRDPECREALARLQRDSRVRFAEPDRRLHHLDSDR